MVSIIKDIKYDDRNNLFTDIYFPEQTSTTNKILIFWHGGGWIKGSKEACQELGVKFAKAGFTTMIPEYRLASQSTFPGAHQDSKTFVEWLLNSQYVTMPRSQQPIYQIGASVGATMALFIAGQFGFDTVCWSAPLDFSEWIKNHKDTVASTDAASELHLTNPRQIKDSFYKFFTVSYAGGEDPSILQKMDAYTYDLDKLNRLLMINSEHELTPLDSVLKFAQTLAQQNKALNLILLPGDQHAMGYADKYIDKSIEFLLH